MLIICKEKAISVYCWKVMSGYMRWALRLINLYNNAQTSLHIPYDMRLTPYSMTSLRMDHWMHCEFTISHIIFIFTDTL